MSSVMTTHSYSNLHFKLSNSTDFNGRRHLCCETTTLQRLDMNDKFRHIYIITYSSPSSSFLSMTSQAVLSTPYIPPEIKTQHLQNIHLAYNAGNKTGYQLCLSGVCVCVCVCVCVLMHINNIKMCIINFLYIKNYINKRKIIKQ